MEAASNVSRWLQLGLLLLVPAAAGARLMGVRLVPFVIGFVAAGELVSAQARNAAVVVKLSQNVLIGVAAFLLTVWWTKRRGGSARDHASAAVICDRFPKFVLGFLAVSLVFSFGLAADAVRDTRPLLNALRTAWFALAFLAIGWKPRSPTSSRREVDGQPTRS